MESVYWQSLIEVARTGSISSAAASLGVTQSGLSRRLKFLEDHYGAQLLERSPTGARLTERGRFVAERARAILALEADLAASVRDEGSERVARLGCSPGWAAIHLSKLIAASDAVDLGPHGLRVTVGAPSTQLDAVSCGAVDVAIVDHDDDISAPGFEVVALPDGELLLVSRPGLGLPATLDSVRALLPHPLITRRAGCCSRIVLDRGLALLGFSLQDFGSVLEVSDLLAQRALVEAGQGFSVLPRPLAEEEVACGRLVAHDVRGLTLRRRRSLVARRAEPGSPVAKLRDLLVAHLAPAPDDGA